jgi:O-antigen/teichoic acid export membrane protein
VASAGTLPLVALAWTLSILAGGVVSLLQALRAMPGGEPSPVPPASIVSFGVKSAAGWVSPTESFRIDQFAVGLFAGPAALGLYVIGLAFTNLPRFVAQNIGLFAYPRLARGAASGGLWFYFFEALVVTAAIVAVLQVAVGPAVPFFFGREFAGAVPFARVLLIGSFFLSLRRVLGDCARGLGQPSLGSKAEVLSWAALVPALPLLGSAWGAMGVAWAMVLSSGAGFAALLGLVLATLNPRSEALSSLRPADASPR